MTVELLIHAIVHQTMVLIAQLATSRRARAPLARVANQVFLDLVRELEHQGVSRKVSADMFGLGLRTYQRKIQRITESSTERGRSLWGAVLDNVQSRDIVTRKEVLLRFAEDDEVQVKSVLHDLCESGLISASGTGSNICYRVTLDEELGALNKARRHEGLDELLWALIYREGPLTHEALAERSQIAEAELTPSLERLLSEKRVERTDEDLYQTKELVLPFGAPMGFEAAVFDHYQAMVNTITTRLREDRLAGEKDRTGGSTYTLEVWPNHPLEDEVFGTLERLRTELGALRERVETHNAEENLPVDHTKVTLYVGQCSIPQGGVHSDEVHNKSPSSEPPSEATQSDATRHVKTRSKEANAERET